MAASKEWWEFHLTPNGWVEGSERLDFGKDRIVEPPIDRLLTRRYHEFMSHYTSPLEKYRVDIWKSADIELIEKLLVKYPHPEPQDHHSKYESRQI